MEPKKLTELRKRLLEERAQVAGHIQQHSPVGNNEPEIGDQADEAERLIELSTQDRLIDSEVHLLEKIDLALRRIEEGTYEKCMGCGAEISAERLMAKPSVSLCLGCQEEKEQRTK